MRLKKKVIIHWETFVVAASCNNEYLWLFNYLS